MNLNAFVDGLLLMADRTPIGRTILKVVLPFLR